MAPAAQQLVQVLAISVPDPLGGSCGIGKSQQQKWSLLVDEDEDEDEDVEEDDEEEEEGEEEDDEDN